METEDPIPVIRIWPGFEISYTEKSTEPFYRDRFKETNYGIYHEKTRRSTSLNGLQHINQLHRSSSKTKAKLPRVQRQAQVLPQSLRMRRNWMLRRKRN